MLGRDTNNIPSDTGVLDSSGRPFPRRPTWRERSAAVSARTKIMIGALLATVAALATLLGNLEKIRSHFRAPPTVPPIVLEVTNGSDQPIEVVSRGDFFLWLPGPGARHAFGKYEFRNPDGSKLASPTFAVEPGSKRRFLAQVLDEEAYAAMLERGDCDVAFMVRKAAGGHRTTGNLPFTKDAIDKYCATVDIGRE